MTQFNPVKTNESDLPRPVQVAGKRLRLLELLLVLAVAFGPALLSSIYVWINGPPADSSSNLAILAGALSECCAIGVLLYVLFRQGRSLKHLGFSLSWRDLPLSLILVLVAWVASSLVSRFTLSSLHLLRGRELSNAEPQNVEFLNSKMTAAYVIFMFVNPICEELVCRAYLIGEIEYLTGSTIAAVVLSVLFQTSYHLYQGLFSAWVLAFMFLVFAVYYAKWRRITPVILAHLYLDMLAMYTYAKR